MYTLNIILSQEAENITPPLPYKTTLKAGCAAGGETRVVVDKRKKERT